MMQHEALGRDVQMGSKKQFVQPTAYTTDTGMIEWTDDPESDLCRCCATASTE